MRVLSQRSGLERVENLFTSTSVRLVCWIREWEGMRSMHQAANLFTAGGGTYPPHRESHRASGDLRTKRQIHAYVYFVHSIPQSGLAILRQVRSIIGCW